MNNYQKHAMREFVAAGWTDANGNWTDEMQEMICGHIFKLLEVFAGEGHSGSSASYAIGLFEKLAKFEPITPLTGEDWEWTDVAEQNGGPLWQNKRCGHVFKDENGAYDIDGIVFYENMVDESGITFKSYFTSRGSRVPVTFPYTPKTEYKEYVE
jgi:hypothetical protein